MATEETASHPNGGGNSGQVKSGTLVFAPRIIRLMADVEAAKEIGTTGFALISHLTCQQDRFGYQRPYKAHAAQLCRELGFSKNTLTKFANKCVEHGWLRLNRSTVRDEAKYWVTIPDHIPDHHKESLSDYLKICGSDQRKICVDRCVDHPKTWEGSPEHPTDHPKSWELPIPNPIPKKRREREEATYLAQTPTAEIKGDLPTQSQVESEFKFVLKGGDEWCLPKAKLREYQNAYPKLDVEAELRKAAQWLIDNPTKRKTERGMPRYLNYWLSGQKSESGRPRGSLDEANVTEQDRARFKRYLDGIASSLGMSTRSPDAREMALKCFGDPIYLEAVGSLIADLEGEHNLRSNRPMLRGLFFRRFPDWLENTRKEINDQEQHRERLDREKREAFERKKRDVIRIIAEKVDGIDLSQAYWDELAQGIVENPETKRAAKVVMGKAISERPSDTVLFFKAEMADEIKAEEVRKKATARFLDKLSNEKGFNAIVTLNNGNQIKLDDGTMYLPDGSVHCPNGTIGRWKSTV
ncbi:hypothetical protein AB1K70_19255 [Bremerella sp. JC770]|uniref:hypothetical protein n=1 Tax=Bremerella sp. JC770 TaxID=3232137 RepID=UPI00345A402D